MGMTGLCAAVFQLANTLETKRPETQGGEEGPGVHEVTTTQTTQVQLYKCKLYQSVRAALSTQRP